MKPGLKPWGEGISSSSADDLIIGGRILTAAFVITVLLAGAYFLLPEIYPDARFPLRNFVLTFIGLMLIVPSLFIKRSKEEVRKNVISIIVWILIMLSGVLVYIVISE